MNGLLPALKQVVKKNTTDSPPRQLASWLASYCSMAKHEFNPTLNSKKRRENVFILLFHLLNLPIE